MNGWRLADKDDVMEVCSDLRPEDIEEGRAMYGVNAATTLPLAFDPKRTWVLLTAEGESVALAGLGPTSLPDVGQIWMVSTPKLFTNRVRFLRRTQAFLSHMHEYHDVLWNYVDARQTAHLKWLKANGFEAVAYRPTWGVAGIPFYEMIRINN